MLLGVVENLNTAGVEAGSGGEKKKIGRSRERMVTKRGPPR